MKIEYLQDRPEFIAELADLHFAEWSYLNPGETLEGKAYYLRSNCGRHGVPSFVIAVEGTESTGPGMIRYRAVKLRGSLGSIPSMNGIRRSLCVT